jgi:hypothetical protein
MKSRQSGKLPVQSGKLPTQSAIMESAWRAALASASHAQQPDVVPPGWLTIHELSQQLGLGIQQVRAKTALLAEQGRAEAKEFRIRIAKGTRVVLHYKLK